MTRPISPPFVVPAPAGARVRTRLHTTEADAAVLLAVGTHLASLAGRDLATRCADATQTSRTKRKQALTAESSSRWAGAITRVSEDSYQLARRNLVAEMRSLRARVGRIRRRLDAPVAGRQGRLRGYASRAEHFEKRRRLQMLEHRLEVVEARLALGSVSVCRGGKHLAHTHHHLDEAGLDEGAWQTRWSAARLFLTADGEAGKRWGNETIRYNPDEGSVELRLPTPLVDLANRPAARYRLSCPVSFSHRGDEVGAQAASGAIRYDIAFDPTKRRWYLDASWKLPARPVPDLTEQRSAPMLALDVNAGHLAGVVVDPSGNALGRPFSIALELAGLSAATRDGRVRAAITELLERAKDAGCKSIAVEDLDFEDARAEGREHQGRRPQRGRRGRAIRRLVAGIPTARFRNRLVQMASNARLFVVAVDPAYTSKWGAQHWLGALKEIVPEASGHHAAALVIGRRGLGQRARRRGGRASTRPEDREERAADSAVWATPAPAGLSEQRQREPCNPGARGQPHPRQKTRRAGGRRREDQVAQDRSGPPTGQDSVLLSV